MSYLKNSSLFRDKIICGNVVDEQLESLLKRVLNDYQEKGFKNKINYNTLFEKLQLDVQELINYFNQIVSKFSDKRFDKKTYLQLHPKEVPSEYRKEISMVRSKIKTRNSMIYKIKKDVLYNLGLHSIKCGDSWFVSDLVPKSYNDLILSDCVESDRLFTFKFYEFQFHHLYKDTELSKFFGKDFVTKVLDLVKSEGVECSEKELRLYLVCRTCEDYKNEDFYVKHRDVLDLIDSVLLDYTEGVRIYSKFNPLGAITMFILSVLEYCDNVYLYHYNYDTITFRLSDEVDFGLFSAHFGVQKKVNNVSHIPSKFVVSNSLKDNLNKLNHK